MSVDEPAISIVVSTVQGWPDIQRNVATWEAAADAADGEVIVIDSSGNPPPSANVLGAATSWRTSPDATIFQGRSAGYSAARAPVVAITEDHCLVPPDWGIRLLDAFVANPRAAAIGGSVENGATSAVIDWASYFVVQASIIPPIVSGPVGRIAGAVNVAYRREALAALDDFDGLGAMDGLHQRQLRLSGAQLVADDSIRVRHDQSLGFRGTTAIHFHAGRTFAGFLRHRMDRLAWLRVAAVGVIPWARFVRAVSRTSARGYLPIVARAWPAMLWLLYCQAAGHVVGFAAGPGDSPRRVQ
ncbi:MAG: glycosyltransferase family 2 protein [Chloroflexota bacterium]